MRTPRSLIVDLSLRFGGASARALGLLGGLPAGTACLACLEGAPVHAEALARGLPCLTLGGRKLDPRIARRLRGVMIEGGFDLLDTQNVQSKLWAAMAAKGSGAALVSTLNSWYLDEQRGRIRGRLYQAIERRTAAATDLYIAVSGEIRSRLTASGIPEAAIELIPNAVGVDPDAVGDDRDTLLRGLGVPPRTRLVVAVGRLVDAKGHADLIDAIGRLGDAEICAVIVGEGELRRDLESRISRLERPACVRLSGELASSEVLRVVKASDAFVMPSVTEGTPIALLEAAALGRPIVATRAGGIPEIVEHGVEALLVPPGDPAALAAELRRVLDDAELARTLGERARERVAARFGLAAQVRATLGAWEKARGRAERHRRR